MGSNSNNDWCRQTFRISRSAALLFVSLISVIALLVVVMKSRGPRVADPLVDISNTVDVEVIRPEVVAFCGDCHAYPDPKTFPRHAWVKEVLQGFQLYEESGRTDLEVPVKEQVVAYYQQLAPEHLTVPKPPAESSPGNVVFRLRPAQRGSGNYPLGGEPSGISHLNWLQLGLSFDPELVACDMVRGDVLLFRPERDDMYYRSIAQLRNPAHSEQLDLDSDGLMDLVIADLGIPQPSNEQLGRVVWLRRTEVEPPKFELVVLADGLGRVADVQAADFNGDTKIDLVVAEFGWRKVGRILLLINESGPGKTQKFKTRVVDSRHGAIHVPPVDLNGDGHIDFVALISQEHETVVAFLNQGNGTFRPETIFSANNPSFGSSGIELTDLDQDGDIDVLYANGDSFDTGELKPFHGIQWLENKGEFPFSYHELTSMPGAHRALSGDMDGDGDIDIVASSMLPGRTLATLESGEVDSIIWLEQIGPHRFKRHTIEKNSCQYACLQLADFDHDGDLDIAVGSFREPYSSSPGSVPLPYINVWWNQPYK